MGIIPFSLPLYHLVSKERFTNVDLNQYCPNVYNPLWMYFQECESWGEYMEATAAKEQNLYIHLARRN